MESSDIPKSLPKIYVEELKRKEKWKEKKEKNWLENRKIKKS